MTRGWKAVGGLLFAALLLLWALSAGTFYLPAPGTARPAGLSTEAAAVDWLNVTVNNQYQFNVVTSPAGPAEITPGDTVRVQVEQLGSDVHTFTLSPTAGFSFPSSDQTSDLVTYFDTNTPLISLNVSPTQGSFVYGNFTAPAYGEYEYVCLEEGHFTLGMFGFLGSGEPGTGSTGTPYNGPGAPVFIIVGVITGLVIIALVLGFVVGKRRGSEDEMPPERLGYPEPPPPKS